MRVKILAIGKKIPNWANDTIETFLKRIPKPYTPQIMTFSTPKRQANAPASGYKAQEAKMLLECIKPDDFVIALDETGASYDSQTFAKKLETIINQHPKLYFILGGPDGLDGQVIKRSNLVLSLSQFTFPHALARVILVEQIYRAWSITCQHPYHRE